MEGTQFTTLAERDAKVIAMLRGSLEAIELTHGLRLAMHGVTGVLNYKKEILALRAALMLLGADLDLPPAHCAPETQFKTPD